MLAFIYCSASKVLVFICYEASKGVGVHLLQGQ